jgi:hypothetical protein
MKKYQKIWFKYIYFVLLCTIIFLEPAYSIEPFDVIISDVGPTKFSVIWFSAQASSCSLSVYFDEDAVNMIQDISMHSESNSHFQAEENGVMKVTVVGVEPSTTYYFKTITQFYVSGDNQISDRIFKVTTEMSASIVNNNSIVQKVILEDPKTPANGILVIVLDIEDASSPLSAWIGDGYPLGYAGIGLSNLFHKDNHINLDIESGTTMTIIVVGGLLGTLEYTTSVDESVDPQILEPVVLNNQYVPPENPKTTTKFVLPAVDILHGKTCSIPLYLSNTEQIYIEGINLDITYDPEVLSPSFNPCSIDQTILAENYLISANHFEPGLIKVVMYCVNTPVQYNGVIAIFHFNVIGQMGASSDISLITSYLNNRSIPVTNGSTTVAGATINGTVLFYKKDQRTNAQKPVSNVLIKMRGDNNYSSYSNAKGEYTQVSVLPGTYSLFGDKYDEAGGLDPTDASIIARYSNGELSLTCLEQLAADVDLDGKILGLDASRVARFGVGLIDQLNEMSLHWLIIPEDEARCHYDYQQETIMYVDKITLDKNFTAIRLGDVTGNWPENIINTRNKRQKQVQPFASSSDNHTFQMSSTETETEQKDIIVPVVISEESILSGIAISLVFDQNVFKPTSVKLTQDNKGILNSSNYALSYNVLEGNLYCWIYAISNPIQSSGNIAFFSFEIVNNALQDAKISVSQLNINGQSTEGGISINGKIAQHIQLSDLMTFNMDIDQNGIIDALTDGLILCAYLRERQNNINIDQFIIAQLGQYANRNNPQLIRDYIQKGIENLDLDFDCNGMVELNRDGILMLRYLFNIDKGNSFLSNAVDLNGSCTDEQSIISRINRVLHTNL